MPKSRTHSLDESFLPLVEARSVRPERIIFRLLDQLLPPIEFLNCTNCSGPGRGGPRRDSQAGNWAEGAPRARLGRGPGPGTWGPGAPHSPGPAVRARGTQLGARASETLQTPKSASDTEIMQSCRLRWFPGVGFPNVPQHARCPWHPLVPSPSFY